MGRNKKLLTITLIIFMLNVSLIGCGKPEKIAANSMDSTESPKTRVITDLAGRKVTIPSEIKRIVVIHGDPEYIVWRLAPDKLVNKDTYFSDSNDRVFPQKFMRDEDIKKFQSLPATGMYSDVSTEQIIMLKPDIVLTLNRDPQIDNESEKFGVPVIGVSKDSLSDFEKSIELIGEIVGNEKGAKELVNYWDDSVKKVTDITSKIPENKKIKVYYTSNVATNTIGPKTTQSSIIRSAGGINFYDENQIDKSLMESESVETPLEEIISWNPDVIITGSNNIKNEILSNDQWKDINAVKNNRVYTTLEYACMDHYESILNLMWTANKLYPDEVKINLNNEAKDFYKEFYYSDTITDEDLALERK
ncbi:ABC transporter substrate-binding protein [Clostridium sp. BL-8]|uniref:ABC transporter substrate-binding protein n=1 Tax=Clostridium sp. BL-8 TaxID=349938 RepID=UPI00098C00C4|nr:ABC transporter substrate-binding protein [Clostridium sp. BL-8]OOM79523.1 high-affinity heme uptake system protein IsdE precursor [Clostridium sp. BL-8]